MLDRFFKASPPGVRTVAAAGATATDGVRGRRGKLTEAAMTQATLDYLKEIQDYNTALKPADYVDEHGETITGAVDPKRFRSVDNDEILRRKIAARTAAKSGGGT